MNAETTVIGSYTAGHNRMFPRDVDDSLWPQYRAVPPLMGPTGLRQTAYWPSGVSRGKFAITDKASDAQARKAMEMANWAYTEEGTIGEDLWPPGELRGHRQLALGRGGRTGPERPSRASTGARRMPRTLRLARTAGEWS